MDDNNKIRKYKIMYAYTMDVTDFTRVPFLVTVCCDD